jgi:ribosomal-protein-alanine N-acetyltransferase
MALLDWITPGDGLRLQGEGIEIRPPRPSDFAEWRDLRESSRSFLQPWEPTWPEDDLTRAAWRRRLASYARDIDLGQAYPFLVFRKDDGALTGGITLSNIRRRALYPPGPNPRSGSDPLELCLPVPGPAST